MQSQFSRFKWAMIFPLFAMLFTSCEKEESLTIDYKYEYFPTGFGHYVIYNVDSIVFDDFTNTSDTFHYQKKHVIDSSFTDNSGRTAYKVIRYQRADSTQPWTLADVWYAVPTQTTLEVNEENQRFVKLLFPPREGQTWRGNQYIDITDANWYLEDWEYSATAVDAPETVGGIAFDSTVTVVQQDYETLIEKVNAEEKYAKNVGMVYKYFLALEKRGDITRPWTNPESGFILTMTVAGYGN